MALLINAHGTATNNAATSVAATLSTVSTGDVLVACIACNSGPLSTVTSTPALTWTLKSIGGTGANDVESWWAIAASTASHTVTATATASTYIDVHAFSVSGADTVTVFDTTGNNVQSGNADCTATTTAANTFIFASYRTGTGTQTAGSPFTLTDTGAGFNFHLTEYNIYTSSVTVTPSYPGTLGGNGALMNSIIQPAAPTVTLMGAICL